MIVKHCYLAALLAALLCSCAAPKSAPHFQDTAAAVGHAQASTERTVVHVQTAQASTTKAQALVKTQAATITKLQQVVAGQKDAPALVLQVKEQNDSLTKELSTTQDALTGAYTELGTVKGDLGTAQQTIVQHEKEMTVVQKQIDKAVLTEKRYHRLKWGIVIPLAAALMGLLIWKFKMVLLPLGYLGIGIMVGVPAAVITFLAFKL